ncbi:MAG: hypothetical protein ACJ0A3_01600 [Dehalococcoidia bacterium]
MNICVVSTFEGDAEEFLSMVAEFDEEMRLAISDYDVGVVKTDKEGSSKIITMLNVIDQERFEEIMSSPKMVEWDKSHNNTDIIYALERIN